MGSLHGVLAPPHTEIARSTREAALESHPYLVTHLERPGRSGGGPGEAPAVVDWLKRGALTQDPPSLYVLQQRRGGRTHRFVVGEVGAEDDDRVLPHEATMEHAVRARAERLLAVRVDSEPLLLVDAEAGPGDASGSTSGLSSLVHRAVLEGHHVAATRGDNVGQVDVWRLDPSATVDELRWAVGSRRWLIGDGHHRWAAARQLNVAPRGSRAVLAAFAVPGEHPLEVAALHRVAPAGSGKSLAGAEQVRPLLSTDAETLLRRLASLREPDCLLIEGGTAAVLHTPGRSSSAWGAAAWVDEALATAGVPGHLVSYVASAGAAIERRRRGSTVILLPTPQVRDIVTAVATGGSMGRKSTSFQPKPLAGTVLRLR
ncbi:DUF1015 domain-containing protein [Paenibacillus sp. TRM 82003]|nr:DUF1015 domain-containing protein [Paenibacillus sp. TRM 82003]